MKIFYLCTTCILLTLFACRNKEDAEAFLTAKTTVSAPVSYQTSPPLSPTTTLTQDKKLLKMKYGSLKKDNKLPHDIKNTAANLR